MVKIGKLRTPNELKNWERIEYPQVSRCQATYDETENYISKKLKFLVGEYKSLGSLQGKRLSRDSIDVSLRRFHQYSIQQQCMAFYFESPQPEKKVFEHIIPASAIRDLLLNDKIDVLHALYPPIANISRNNDQKLRDARLVKSNNDLWHPFKRYVTSGIFASSKIVDCFDNEINPNSFTLSDHYNYINELFVAIQHIQSDSLRLSPLKLLEQLKLR